MHVSQVRFWLFADGRSHPFFQSNLVSGTPSSTQRNQVIRYPGGFQGRNDSASQNAFEDEVRAVGQASLQSVLSALASYHECLPVIDAPKPHGVTMVGWAGIYVIRYVIRLYMSYVIHMSTKKINI